MSDKPGKKTVSTGLTAKEQRFVESYDGNASAAARLAGYSTPGVEGHQLLKKPKIIAAIRARENNRVRPVIADRQTRQAFWTQTMGDQTQSMLSRLKASELLAKSEGDFLERLQLSGDDNQPLVIRWGGSDV